MLSIGFTTRQLPAALCEDMARPILNRPDRIGFLAHCARGAVAAGVLWGLVSLVLFSFSAFAQMPQTYGVVMDTTPPRLDASGSSPQAGFTLELGARVVIVERRPGWILIQTDNFERGWVQEPQVLDTGQVAPSTGAPPASPMGGPPGMMPGAPPGMAPPGTPPGVFGQADQGSKRIAVIAFQTEGEVPEGVDLSVAQDFAAILSDRFAGLVVRPEEADVRLSAMDRAQLKSCRQANCALGAASALPADVIITGKFEVMPEIVELTLFRIDVRANAVMTWSNRAPRDNLMDLYRSFPAAARQFFPEIAEFRLPRAPEFNLGPVQRKDGPRKFWTPLKIAGFSAAGTGVAMTVLAAYFGSRAKAARGQLDDYVARSRLEPGAIEYATLEPVEKSLKSKSRAANITLTLGLVSFSASGILFYLDYRQGQQAAPAAGGGVAGAPSYAGLSYYGEF